MVVSYRLKLGENGEGIGRMKRTGAKELTVSGNDSKKSLISFSERLPGCVHRMCPPTNGGFCSRTGRPPYKNREWASDALYITYNTQFSFAELQFKESVS